MIELVKSTRRTFLGRVAAAVVSSVPAAVALARPRPALGWGICAGELNCRFVGSRCLVDLRELFWACFDAYTGTWCYTEVIPTGPC